MADLHWAPARALHRYTRGGKSDSNMDRSSHSSWLLCVSHRTQINKPQANGNTTADRTVISTLGCSLHSRATAWHLSDAHPSHPRWRMAWLQKLRSMTGAFFCLFLQFAISSYSQFAILFWHLQNTFFTPDTNFIHLCFVLRNSQYSQILFFWFQLGTNVIFSTIVNFC